MDEHGKMMMSPIYISVTWWNQMYTHQLKVTVTITYHGLIHIYGNMLCRQNVIRTLHICRHLQKYAFMH